MTSLWKLILSASMFDEYCFVLLLDNKETANSLNEEQAGYCRGCRKFKLDSKQPRTIRLMLELVLLI